MRVLFASFARKRGVPVKIKWIVCVLGILVSFQVSSGRAETQQQKYSLTDLQSLFELESCVLKGTYQYTPTDLNSMILHGTTFETAFEKRKCEKKFLEFKKFYEGNPFGYAESYRDSPKEFIEEVILHMVGVGDTKERVELNIKPARLINDEYYTLTQETVDTEDVMVVNARAIHYVYGKTSLTFVGIAEFLGL